MGPVEQSDRLGMGMEKLVRQSGPDSSSVRSPSARSSISVEGDREASQRSKPFQNAKSISSDQYFGRERAEERDPTFASRFQGAKAISSADYFGREESRIEEDADADVISGLVLPRIHNIRYLLS